MDRIGGGPVRLGGKKQRRRKQVHTDDTAYGQHILAGSVRADGDAVRARRRGGRHRDGRCVGPAASRVAEGDLLRVGCRRVAGEGQCAAQAEAPAADGAAAVAELRGDGERLAQRLHGARAWLRECERERRDLEAAHEELPTPRDIQLPGALLRIINREDGVIRVGGDEGPGGGRRQTLAVGREQRDAGLRAILHDDDIQVADVGAHAEVARGRAAGQRRRCDIWPRRAAVAQPEDIQEERHDVERRDARHDAVPVVIRRARGGAGQAAEKRMEAAAIRAERDGIHRPAVLFELGHDLVLNRANLPTRVGVWRAVGEQNH